MIGNKSNSTNKRISNLRWLSVLNIAYHKIQWKKYKNYLSGKHWTVWRHAVHEWSLTEPKSFSIYYYLYIQTNIVRCLMAFEFCLAIPWLLYVIALKGSGFTIHVLSWLKLSIIVGGGRGGGCAFNVVILHYCNYCVMQNRNKNCHFKNKLHSIWWFPLCTRHTILFGLFL